MIVHTSILIRYCIYDILNIYINYTYHLIDSVSASVCARFTQSGIIAGLATAGWPGDTSLNRHCRCEFKKKTLCNIQTHKHIISYDFYVYVILYLWIYIGIYIVYTCLFIYHIWLSDIIVMTWEYLGDFRTSTLTSQVMQPQWISSRCRSSVSAYLKDWNTSVIGIGSLDGPQAERISERISGPTWTNPCHPNAIPMPYHPMSDQTTHATA